jgi:hypothetical protein
MKIVSTSALLVLFPAIALSQPLGPVSVNGGHVTLNADSGGSVNLAVAGVKQFSSDGSLVTSGGLVAVATAAATPPQLTGNIAVVPTVAAGSSIMLPACDPGRVFRVKNAGSNSIKIWPATGGTLDGSSANVTGILAGGSTATIVCTSSTAAQTFSGVPLPTPTP